MSEILPDDVQALRDALDTSPDAVTVTLSLTRSSAEKVLERRTRCTGEGPCYQH